MFNNRCYNGGDKHKFEPRHTEVETGLAKRITRVKGFLERELLVRSAYIGDICVWCGLREDHFYWYGNESVSE